MCLLVLYFWHIHAEAGETTTKGDNYEKEETADFEKTYFNDYLAMHRYLAAHAEKFATHHDLSSYKSCIDLGGEPIVLIRNNFHPKFFAFLQRTESQIFLQGRVCLED